MIAPQRIVKVDLGCGPVKRDGFIGIDRFAMRGVDIVCGLDRGIPLSDDSVDYLVASHSLEHVRDLPRVIHEMHRICKDRALITIVAPYAATGLNQANPYHLQRFNEHTARFFSNAGETVLPPDDYDFPGAGYRGLGSSDHSNWQADLRRRRAQDLSTLIAPAFIPLKTYGEAHDLGGRGAVIQESELWQAGQAWIYDVPAEAGTITGLRLAITALSEPHAPTALFDCEVWSEDSAHVLASSPVVVSKDCGIRPVEVTFSNVAIPAGRIRVRLQALPGIEKFGIRMVEWRRLNLLRRVRSAHLYCEPLYSRQGVS
ncbi:methyltransferase domain-containing protein [Burkholderia sp. Ac-20353]|uniref:class I SAM-dependent methyltransferase n=1 Tax=Burkholderia sp. Ac-20353 TaxID=2703894 RepID=UPI00197BD73A|nr:methyltransferase domain-containing protein [Burkholderia sp. Ac-20353]MBN3791223.1 class I SAM-dependent methyltransferase [Burkholderia sp. Ac-20353]